MTIKALIVDDEPLARKRLERLLSGFEQVEIVGIATNGQEAVDLAYAKQPDLIFMDVEMPIKTGITASKEILENSKKVPAIIFCTAYDQYAIDAFKINADAYLLKPISAEDISSAIVQASQLTQFQRDSVSPLGLDKTVLSFKFTDGIEKIDFSTIIYFRSERKIIIMGLLNDKEVVLDYTLKDLENKLGKYVLRVHRNTLVMRNKLQRLVHEKDGSVLLELEGSSNYFSVSRRLLSEVKKCFV